MSVTAWEILGEKRSRSLALGHNEQNATHPAQVCQPNSSILVQRMNLQEIRPWQVSALHQCANDKGRGGKGRTMLAVHKQADPSTRSGCRPSMVQPHWHGVLLIPKQCPSLVAGLAHIPAWFTKHARQHDQGLVTLFESALSAGGGIIPGVASLSSTTFPQSAGPETAAFCYTVAQLPEPDSKTSTKSGEAGVLAGGGGGSGALGPTNFPVTVQRDLGASPANSAASAPPPIITTAP